MTGWGVDPQPQRPERTVATPTPQPFCCATARRELAWLGIAHLGRQVPRMRARAGRGSVQTGAPCPVSCMPASRYHTSKFKRQPCVSGRC